MKTTIVNHIDGMETYRLHCGCSGSDSLHDSSFFFWYVHKDIFMQQALKFVSLSTVGQVNERVSEYVYHKMISNSLRSIWDLFLGQTKLRLSVTYCISKLNR